MYSMVVENIKNCYTLPRKLARMPVRVTLSQVSAELVARYYSRVYLYAQFSGAEAIEVRA